MACPSITRLTCLPLCNTPPPSLLTSFHLLALRCTGGGSTAGPLTFHSPGLAGPLSQPLSLRFPSTGWQSNGCIEPVPGSPRSPSAPPSPPNASPFSSPEPPNQYGSPMPGLQHGLPRPGLQHGLRMPDGFPPMPGGLGASSSFAPCTATLPEQPSGQQIGQQGFTLSTLNLPSLSTLHPDSLPPLPPALVPWERSHEAMVWENWADVAAPNITPSMPQGSSAGAQAVGTAHSPQLGPPSSSAWARAACSALPSSWNTALPPTPAPASLEAVRQLPMDIGTSAPLLGPALVPALAQALFEAEEHLPMETNSTAPVLAPVPALFEAEGQLPMDTGSPADKGEMSGSPMKIGGGSDAAAALLAAEGGGGIAEGGGESQGKFGGGGAQLGVPEHAAYAAVDAAHAATHTAHAATYAAHAHSMWPVLEAIGGQGLALAAALGLGTGPAAPSSMHPPNAGAFGPSTASMQPPNAGVPTPPTALSFHDVDMDADALEVGVGVRAQDR